MDEEQLEENRLLEEYLENGVKSENDVQPLLAAFRDCE